MLTVHSLDTDRVDKLIFIYSNRRVLDRKIGDSRCWSDLLENQELEIEDEYLETLGHDGREDFGDSGKSVKGRTFQHPAKHIRASSVG